ALPLGACGDAQGPAAGEAHLLKDLGPGSSRPDLFSSLGHLAQFGAGREGSREAWRTDGTAAGTLRLADAATPAGATRLYLGFDEVHGLELWKTDGTAAGTGLVKDIDPAPRESSSPHDFTEVAGSVYFLARIGLGGSALWKSDGTEAGTVLVADIDRLFPQDLREFGGRLYFLGDDGGDGLGLWRSDGTAQGTRLVAAVPREGPTNPRDIRGPV